MILGNRFFLGVLSGFCVLLILFCLWDRWLTEWPG